tara:strand:- start:10 stop:336 length:327 start_codon:yes stop_codon:yes gene_type:complete
LYRKNINLAEMEDNIKIKLNIGDRLYPLTIQRSQEFYFREAAKVIENTIKNLEENYSVRDKQDLLAMCCIQFAAKNLQNKSNSSDTNIEVEKIILKMIDDIDKSILTS